MSRSRATPHGFVHHRAGMPSFLHVRPAWQTGHTHADELQPALEPALKQAAQSRVILALDVRQGEALLRSVHPAARETRAGSRRQRHVEADDVAQVLPLEIQLTS